jgi:hypothetical protein
MARSGANEEAQSKGAASIALPIAQQAQQLRQQALLGQLGAMSSILNGLPYSSQPRVSTEGNANTGIITSYLGGSGASGMASMFGGSGASGAGAAGGAAAGI